MTLAGQTLFISGGSRGIGLAIALRAARDGANATRPRSLRLSSRPSSGSAGSTCASTTQRALIGS